MFGVLTTDTIEQAIEGREQRPEIKAGISCWICNRNGEFITFIRKLPLELGRRRRARAGRARGAG